MMTGESTYRDNPRYQRLIQRYMTMGPEQKAVVNTAYADREMAGEEARRELEGLRMGAQEQARRGSLDLASRRLDMQQGLYDDRKDFLQGQGDMAEKIGVLGVGAQGALGWMEGDMARQRAARLRGMMSKFDDLGR